VCAALGLPERIAADVLADGMMPRTPVRVPNALAA
jgi:hypothetical protein